MKLHWSPRSPYVRKVMIVAHERGLQDRIALTRTPVVMTEINRTLLPDNPLNKIPTLILDDGSALYDSAVICEYLDALDGAPSIFPPPGPARWTALRRQALGAGITDALISWRQERLKPDAKRNEPLVVAFDEKVRTALDRLEGEAADLAVAAFDIGHVGIGCALSYLDYRFGDLGWRSGRPGLAAWQETFEARPSAMANKPADG